MKTIAQIGQFLQQRQLITDDKLASLMAGFSASTSAEFCFSDLTNDSRQVDANSVFVALQGIQSHALDYLHSALQKGCGLVLTDRELNSTEQAICVQHQAQVVVIEDLLDHQAALAVDFFDYPSRQLKVIGITGTNGKTSTAFYCAQLLQQLGQKVAMIGTLGYGLLDDLQKGMNTTPDVLQVQRLMAQFVKFGADYVVMEVSSHAVELGRIRQLHFTTLALTQVTSDHLDFHGSQEAYEAAKIKLFSDYDADHKVVNLNDHIGEALVNRCHPHCLNHHDCDFWGYSLTKKTIEQPIQPKEWLNLCLLSATDLRLSSEGMQFNLLHSGQTFEIEVPLLGAFNAENLLCAISCVLANGFDENQVITATQRIQSVAGRMQIVHRQPTVLVDFAHTADALEKLLQAVKSHQQGTDEQPLYVVFGCGGDRDRQKRPVMAKVAEQYASQVIVTSDNPRSEQPQTIIDEVVAGLTQPQDALVEVDRQLAIEKALQLSLDNANAIVVIAGKGHEDYQEIAGKRYPFSDAAVVQQWFQRQVKSEGK